MAAAVSFSQAVCKALQSVQTVTLTGLAASTAHVASITNPQGHVATINVTSDGSGNASFKFTPDSAGIYSVSVVAPVVSPVVTGTFRCGGFS